jgi:hypothetical protein
MNILAPRKYPNPRKGPLSVAETETHRLAYAIKHPPGHAQCGIRWTTIREANSPLGASIVWRAWEANPAGSGWTHCHACGQALIYTTDPNAQPQVCAGRRPLASAL